MELTDNQKRESDSSEVDRSSTTMKGATYRVLDALRRSFFLSLTFVGVLLLVAGVVRGDGVVAGMLGIWGATAIGIGLSIYATLWYLRDY